MAKFGGSAIVAFEADYEFQVFATDENDHLRTPTPVKSNDNSYFFEGAVENFQARFADFGLDALNEGSPLDADVINITNLFAERDEEQSPLAGGERDELLLSSGLSSSGADIEPLTLDLTTDLVNDDMGRRINYIIDGDELELLENDLGGVNISELTLFIEDADMSTPGFQLDQDQDTSNGFQIFTEGIDTNIPQEATIIKENDIPAALSDIEFIIYNDLLGSITSFDLTVGNTSLSDAGDVLINRGSVIIPNSDDVSRFDSSKV